MHKDNAYWKKIQNNLIDKVTKHLDYYTDAFPGEIPADGDKYNLQPAMGWVSGFWPGILNITYKSTRSEKILDKIRHFERVQNDLFQSMEVLHHDTGFMYYLSCAMDYNMTGNEEAKKNALNAACVLASRFNPKGGFIRAWNNDVGSTEERAGWVIIDCMMNLELLYWASEVSNDARFKHIANAHADSTMKNFIRDDGTTKHICEYDPETGEYIKNQKGQGYSEESAWTRGMGWAVAGFAKAYGYTKNEEYLKTAKKVSEAFYKLLPKGEIAPCDFNQPNEPLYYDSSASAVVACGMLDIARLSPSDKDTYLDMATDILETLTQKCADFNPENEGILRLSTQAYHFGYKNCTLIYGDYYYVEAIDKLIDMIK